MLWLRQSGLLFIVRPSSSLHTFPYPHIQTSMKHLSPYEDKQEVFYYQGIQLESESAEMFTKKEVVSP